MAKKRRVLVNLHCAIPKTTKHIGKIKVWFEKRAQAFIKQKIRKRFKAAILINVTAYEQDALLPKSSKQPKQRKTKKQ